MARTRRPERDAGTTARADLLDVAERLMSERGYAATSVSAISRAAGVAVTSLYWHFGSKEGLLAALMERGAQRWFDALPRVERLTGTPEERSRALLAGGADAVASHPLFLRLFYMLALEASEDEAAAELIRRVRDRAFEYFRTAIARLLVAEQPAEVAEAAAGELARFAVAYSDGCFFAGQLEPDRADLRRMYGELWVALRALAPGAIARATEGDRP